MPNKNKAKGFQRHGRSVQPPVHSLSTRLSPSPVAEVRASWSRALRIHKAETIGADMNIKRARVYEIAGKPGQTQIRHLEALAEFDPDPEFMQRLGHCLLAWAAARAARRQAEGGRITILQQMGVRVQADAESVRRASGRGEDGDD